MSLLNDLVTEIETYPHTYLTPEIIEVDPSGDNINAGEEGTFTLQLTNSGPLDVLNLSLLVTGKHGTQVRQAGAADVTFGPTAISNTFAVVPGDHPNAPVRMPGGRMFFKAPSTERPFTELLEVSVDTWDTDFSRPFLKHSDPDPSASTTYSDEVLPSS